MNLQEALDDYLEQTGLEKVVAEDFRDWLAERPDHPLYERFLGEAQQDAARKWEVHKIRMAISGLRITVRQVEAKRHNVGGIAVKHYPAFHSPVPERQSGGGYVRTRPELKSSIANLRAEGLMELRGWLDRYGDAFGADADLIREMLELFSEAKEVA